MVGYSLRQLLMDGLTLDEYENYSNVDWSDIKRRLIINEHKVNPSLTDNHLWAAFEHYEIDNLEKLLTEGFRKLSMEFLETVDDKIYVKKERFSEWQELLTFCPALILIAAYSFYDGVDISDIQHTALLSPYIKELENIKKANLGFNDLHIHLNGSTETDILWQDALFYSNEFRKNYRGALKVQYVKEQKEQESVFKDSNHLFNLLTRAKALRYYLVKKFEEQYPSSDKLRDEYSQYQERDIHPFRNERNKDLSDLNLECLMFKELFNKLHNGGLSVNNKAKLVKAFHHYLLILGCMNRFVVQQVHQNGFQQFQKLTVNEFRSYSEKKYEKRLFQLSGNNINSNFKMLEGRFAPKKTPLENDKLIAKIRQGWYTFKDLKRVGNPELRLVCHFIKKSTSQYDAYRHEKLRQDLWIQANAIKSLKDDIDWMLYPKEDEGKNFKKLVAIDAAASEFDASPEVFAPIFRFLRRQDESIKEGFRNITFHVGEDFLHIVSGLRVIYEAIDFLEMKSGDRIGHGTALGVCPQLWKGRVGKSLYISKGEWIDNLVFIIYILELQSSQLYEKIEFEIRRYISDIYPFKFLFSISDLIEAWKLRKWDPENLLTSSISDIDPLKEDKWKSISELSFSGNTINFLKHYHRNIKEYNKKILIDFDIINEDVISQLQQKLLFIINDKEVIVETLPTSNVRIGIYKDHKEHHLKKWIKEDFITNLPKIVVGCDDAGIFATNIYNEYAHIYMMYQKNQNSLIKKLISQSEISVFLD